jgi:hypothetical protein
LKAPTIFPCSSVNAETGVEFGLILSVKKAKGEVLEYRIDHPPFTDEQGNIAPPFEGTYYISSNDFRFFSGRYCMGTCGRQKRYLETFGVLQRERGSRKTIYPGVIKNKRPSVCRLKALRQPLYEVILNTI